MSDLVYSQVFPRLAYRPQYVLESVKYVLFFKSRVIKMKVTLLNEGPQTFPRATINVECFSFYLSCKVFCS